MPKRIRYIILITILVLLGFFVANKIMSASHSKQAQTSSPSSKKKPLQTIPTKKHENVATSPTNKREADTKLSTFLKAPEVKIQDKVYRIRDLDLNPTISLGKENIKELVIFINSENPYARDPQAKVPHSVGAYRFQKEASLRVYSIKRLSQSLPLPELETQIQNIINGSDDPTIARIAKQVFEAKQNGKDYIENMKQGLRSKGIPDQQPEGEASHSHH